MKPKTVTELRTEAAHLRKALDAGGLPAATRAFVHSKLVDVEAQIYQRTQSAESATP